MSESAKLLSFSDMLQRQAREENEARKTGVVQPATVAQHARGRWHDATVARHATVAQHVTLESDLIQPERYTNTPNDVWDKLMPTLDVHDQVVLWQLYRLTRGFGSDTCRIGLERLRNRCNCSKRQIQISVERLEKRGLIRRTGADYGNADHELRGTEYVVNIPAARANSERANEPKSGVEQHATVAYPATNKENTLNNTPTQRKNVRVCSRFTLSECRRYAESLRPDGITNPGGYATRIHRSGEADDLVAKFLNPAVAAPSPSVDTSLCPDCNGTGFWEPGGAGKGVAKCKHAQLAVEHTSAPDEREI